jgi:uncharacterized cupin superfamily protein
VEPGVSHTRLDFEAEERFVRIRNALGVSSFGLNLLLLRPGQGSRIHRHAHQEEVYVVLEGRLTLEYDGERHEFRQGDAIRVAPDVKRQLSNRGDELLSLLAVGGAERHEGRDGIAYLAWDDEEGKAPADVPLPDDLED